jgi:hypothetical protein
LATKQLTITVLIEKGEGLLELSNLLFGKLISHCGKRLERDKIWICCAPKRTMPFHGTVANDAASTRNF